MLAAARLARNVPMSKQPVRCFFARKGRTYRAAGFAANFAGSAFTWEMGRSVPAGIRSSVGISSVICRGGRSGRFVEKARSRSPSALSIRATANNLPYTKRIRVSVATWRFVLTGAIIATARPCFRMMAAPCWRSLRLPAGAFYEVGAHHSGKSFRVRKMDPSHSHEQFDELGRITADMTQEEVARRTRATNVGALKPAG